jgi:hypothetical protein
MALFPPQARDWQLPGDVALTPHALRRVSREAALQPFDRAAAALNEDWGTTLDGTQVQRWAEAVGTRLARERDTELREAWCGRPPAAPPNAPALLVIGLDGGRVQMREKDPETGSRWREDKVAAVTTYQAGDGADRKPKPLVTTYVGTMAKAEAFGRLARVEAQRRGMDRAGQVLVLGDGGNWIDPVVEREFSGAVRILDWAHAREHLHDCARALHGPESPASARVAKRLKGWLYAGEVERVIRWLEEESRRLGPAREEDGPEHPRRVLSTNAGYFRKNAKHMHYPEYRRRGWPIGSGNVESGIKQFNKRVKGTEQFWQPEGVEAMLALRGLWLDQDQRWQRYWLSRPAYRAA